MFSIFRQNFHIPPTFTAIRQQIRHVHLQFTAIVERQTATIEQQSQPMTMRTHLHLQILLLVIGEKDFKAFVVVQIGTITPKFIGRRWIVEKGAWNLESMSKSKLT